MFHAGTSEWHKELPLLLEMTKKTKATSLALKNAITGSVIAFFDFFCRIHAAIRTMVVGLSSSSVAFLSMIASPNVLPLSQLILKNGSPIWFVSFIIALVKNY